MNKSPVSHGLLAAHLDALIHAHFMQRQGFGFVRLLRNRLTLRRSTITLRRSTIPPTGVRAPGQRVVREGDLRIGPARSRDGGYGRQAIEASCQKLSGNF